MASIKLCCAWVAVLAVAGVPSAWAEVKTWRIDKYTNIVRNQSPPAVEQPLAELQIALAQGEFRDQVFMIGPATEEVRLNLRVTGLETLPAGFVEILETAYMKNRVDQETETGDEIRPLRGELQIPKGESRQIWLRADTRNHAVTPGVYPFTVELRGAGNGAAQSLPGRVEVWNFELPSHDVLPNNAWAEFDASAFKDGAMNAKAVADMKMFGINTVFVLGRETPRVTAIDGQNQVLAFDDAVFLARMRPILEAWAKAPGKERLQFIFTLGTGLDLGLPKIFDGNLGAHPQDAKWTAVFAQWLKHLQATMKELGVADRDWLMAIIDESPLATLLTKELSYAELIKSIDPRIRTTTNSSFGNEPFSYGTIIGNGDYVVRLFNAFDVFQPNLYCAFMGTYPAFPEWLMANARKYGKEVWAYQANVDLGVVRAKGDGYWEGKNLYSYYRVYAWHLLKYGLTGTGLWTYCAQGAAAEGTGCQLVYARDGELVHSRRYEMFREGLDDYRYVWLLRDLAKKKGAAAEQRAEKRVQEALADITANVGDTSRCDTWRRRIAAQILEFSGR